MDIITCYINIKCETVHRELPGSGDKRKWHNSTERETQKETQWLPIMFKKPQNKGHLMSVAHHSATCSCDPAFLLFMRPGSASHHRSLWGRCSFAAKICGGILLFHLLAVIVLSAQSTAAGGPLILFPLATLWHGGESSIAMARKEGVKSVFRGLEMDMESDLKPAISVDEQLEKRARVQSDARSEKSDANVFPNPIRLPVLPKSPPPLPPPPPPPPPLSEEAQRAAQQDEHTVIAQDRMQRSNGGEKEHLLEQLRYRRREVERLMAKRRAEREGISIEEAERRSATSNAEAADKAVLAVEKPQNNVRQAFNGGQNGRFLPAPKILANLFRRDDRPKEDKSWLDRVTDAIIDKLELRWEEDEEARIEDDELKINNLQLGTAGATSQRKPIKQWPADECASTLKIPKVAMMFLTKGDLYHSSTWELWFKFANGLLPVDPVRAACGKAKVVAAAQKACSWQESGTAGEQILANQHLFNVYVHVGMNNQEFRAFGSRIKAAEEVLKETESRVENFTPVTGVPLYAGFSKDTLWYNRDIIERVQVEWGRHSLVTATRNLMKIALQEPLNKRFILLSEAGIPLYPPTALYNQLMSEDKSRINACSQPGWERHPHRWTDRMETPQMKHHHWRKSSQWFALKREHVELVMADSVINNVFLEHCYPTTEEGWWRDCFSDEHYFSTLLAVLGRENETDCKGFMMHVDWSRGGAHPRTYELREVSAARLRLLRMPTDNCGYPSAIKTAGAQFMRQEDLSPSTCQPEVVEYSKTLGPQCPLFARKFAPETASAITALISECKNRLKIVHGGECHRRLAMLKKHL